MKTKTVFVRVARLPEFLEQFEHERFYIWVAMYLGSKQPYSRLLKTDKEFAVNFAKALAEAGATRMDEIAVVISDSIWIGEAV